MTRLSLPHTVALLAVLYAAGAAWAVADDIAPTGDALLNGTYLNAPLVIIGAQVLGTLARRSRAGAGLVLLACTVSLAAVAFDGDLGHAGLSTAQVAHQVAIAGTTALTWVLAAQAAFARGPVAAGMASRSA